MDITEHLNEIVLPRTNHITDKHQAILNAALGIAGESGEIVDLIKKFEFHGHPFDLSKLQNEIGDVLFYLNWLAYLNGTDIESCLEVNAEKLRKRYPNGFNSKNSIERKDTK
jgi:NTP pyrophosphatase (non-canonical NTP hydrolase)